MPGHDSSQATTGILERHRRSTVHPGVQGHPDMDQNSWDVGNVPDKDDILDAFAARLRHRWQRHRRTSALDRFANNGDAHAASGSSRTRSASTTTARSVASARSATSSSSATSPAAVDLSTVSLYTWTGSGLSAARPRGIECTPGVSTGVRDLRNTRRPRSRRGRTFRSRGSPGSSRLGQLLRGWGQSRRRLPERCALYLVVHGRDAGVHVHDGRAQELRPRRVPDMRTAGHRDPGPAERPERHQHQPGRVGRRRRHAERQRRPRHGLHRVLRLRSQQQPA